MSIAPLVRGLVSAPLVRALVIASTVPWLGGCLSAAVAVYAAPAVMGTAAMAGADPYSPFVHYADARPDALARLDEDIRAAECGDASAQYRLAGTLANGFNQTPDRVEVLKWYRLAEQGGEPRAAAVASSLEAVMPAGDVARAQALAQGWAPRTEGCPTAS